MIQKEINENGLVADLFTDASLHPRKAIGMLGGSEGGKSWSRIKRPNEILVQQGYAVLSLAYFKAQDLPISLEEIPIEYFERAFTWLSAQRGLVPNEVALLGGPKGAEAALLLGSLYPDYENHFSTLESRDNLVLIIGHSTCSIEPVDGPALWTAKIENDLVAEWRVYFDTIDNRIKLGLNT